MTVKLPGYQTEQLIYTGTRTLVYRGQRQSDSQPVVIKLLRNEYPSFNELVQFRNQYAIMRSIADANAKNLKIPGIIRPYSLESYGNSYALVMEDWGGISLNHCQPLTPEEILSIAIQLAEILHELHQNRVIHKDIKPANILLHPQSKQVKLIDFSIASLLPKETQEIKNPNGLEGTLAYISPEQTGRMNRGIDYRTDFYSLGVTLFELLTGQLPFSSNDPMELVHCHMAKMPETGEKWEQIPQVLSAIVMKLMAKNAEDRYQSALGLKFDLETCLTQLKETGQIEAFEIGTRDRCDRFNIPEKLYGREREVQILLDAFERIAQGTSELMLVAGFSGIGKTAVVNEVHKPIVRQQGYFIKGKFDQFNRNIPFSAFVQAFRDLMGQLLCESDTQLQTWKTHILEALGDNAQVVIEVIPELECLIGEQPSVPELSGTAAQNRFNLLFHKFLQVFTTKEHPLVMFLDDLQWADSASLKLMQLLMGDSPTGYLLMIGAYRDNEVFPAHPLMLTLDEVGKAGTTVNTITLKPLSNTSLNQLVADTLSCAEGLAQPLTELVYQKTQGNPFFATQFLKALHQDGLITFEVQAGYWQCDIVRVREAALTDDVVEFMALQLQKLSVETQEVLKLAACIGNQFDLKTLAIVSEQSESEAADALWKALQDGLILPISETYKFFQGSDSESRDSEKPRLRDRRSEIIISYKFLHDRVQQAAYSLIPEDQKQLTHWKIGQLLRQELSQTEQTKQIFDIVNQLNLGRATITEPFQIQQLIQLNLQAGQKAKLASAYQAAQNYYAIGIDLLPPEAWHTDYALTYALYREGSEASYLCGDFEQAEYLYAIALTHAQTPLDKAVIYRVQMTQYQLQGRNGEAIAIQRQSLQLLGWEMPGEAETIQAYLDEQITIVNQFLEQQTIASILEFSCMEDANIAEILRILQILFYAAWLDGQSTLALLAIAKMTTLSLQYGNSEMSPFGYVGYGLIANAVLKNARQAHQFGEIAVQLCEQFDNADVRGMTNFLFAADVHSWSRPLRAADTYYDNAFKYGMDAGNWLTVGFMMMLSGSDRLTYGKNLDDLYVIAQTHADFLRQIKSFDNLDILRAGLLQPIRQLLGLTTTSFNFDDDSFSEAEYLQKYNDAPFPLAWLYAVKIRHAYLLNQPATYPDLIPTLSIIEKTVASHAKVPSSVFYVALMHLKLLEISSDEADRQSHWQAIIPLEERLTNWEQDCPENIRHKCLLIQAEKARLNSQKSEAINLYDQAIVQAQNQGYGYEAALANELAAKFYLDWGKEKVAAGYMQEAYYGYAHWGAKAKTDDLEQRYPNLLHPILQKAAQTLNPLETLASITGSHSSFQTSKNKSFSSTHNIKNTIDFAAIIKASYSFSNTINIDELLHQLTQVILQNSGADSCALILPNCQGEWQLRSMANLETTELCAERLEKTPHLPIKLIQYVKNTQEVVAFDDINTDIPVICEYLLQERPKSVLCLPILNQGELCGILYLENRSTAGVFTNDRLLILNFLCTQAAISLENARLYQQAQDYAQQLEQSQLQLIQSEKMSALGNLVAGVAHEINNPVGFIAGNLQPAQDYVKDLLGLLDLYAEEYPQPTEIIEEEIEAIDLEFIRKDLPKLIGSMKEGTDRISHISTSLRTFSRTDSDRPTLFNLHDGIDSTLLILKHRLKANEKRPEIKVIKTYGKLPQIHCFAGQLNQVFMNILANAIDAIDEGVEKGELSQPCIQIHTETLEQSVVIRIKDNAMGMPEKVKSRIFDHLFTTKSVGKGTGLGLAIARQIVVEKHGGTIEVNSTLRQGTEFTIALSSIQHE